MRSITTRSPATGDHSEHWASQMRQPGSRARSPEVNSRARPTSMRSAQKVSGHSARVLPSVR